MAALVTQTPAITGVAITYAAAGAGGDTISPSDGKTLLHVKNASGGSITVTVAAVGTCSQGFLHDAVVAVPASGDRAIGPFDSQRFTNGSGQIAVTYSATASVTVAAIRVA